jgi:hypothetical protein
MWCPFYRNKANGIPQPWMTRFSRRDRPNYWIMVEWMMSDWTRRNDTIFLLCPIICQNISSRYRVNAQWKKSRLLSSRVTDPTQIDSKRPRQANLHMQKLLGLEQHYNATNDQRVSQPLDIMVQWKVQNEQSVEGSTSPTQPSAHFAFRIVFVKETSLEK